MTTETKMTLTQQVFDLIQRAEAREDQHDRKPRPLDPADVQKWIEGLKALFAKLEQNLYPAEYELAVQTIASMLMSVVANGHIYMCTLHAMTLPNKDHLFIKLMGDRFAKLFAVTEHNWARFCAQIKLRETGFARQTIEY